VQHVPHRWFSVFSMLERMVELKPFLCRLCQQTSHDNWFPTEGDWDAAVWLLDTLRPLKTVSDNLEKCHDVTISLVRHQLLPAKVIPSVRVIADDLETKLSAGLGMRPDEKRALRCLIKKLQSCFGPTAPELTTTKSTAPELTTMLIASFLDPRTKGMDKHTDEEKKMVKNAVIQALGSSQSDRMFSDEQIAAARSLGRSIEDIRKTEMSRYSAIEPIDSWEDSALWWRDNCHSYPGIARLARKYLAVPASSVPSERVFSSAGNFANKRGRLDPDALERDVLLHHYLNEKKRLDSFVSVRSTIPVLIM